MGNGTPVVVSRDGGRFLGKMGKTNRSVRLGIDVPLLLVVITLVIFGLLMVYSASWDYSLVVLEKAPSYMFTRQLLWLILGIGVAVFFSLFNYHRWQKWAILVMALTIGSLIGVLVMNEVVNNAVRTLWGGSVQPSELAKLTTIIYLSVWLYAKRETLHSVGFGLLPLAGILGVVGGFIVAQPDLSATATIFIIGGLLFFLGGGDLRQIALFLVMALVIGVIVFRFNPTGSTRITEYLTSIKDPTQAPYHLERSLEAVVKGGWFGVGIGLADTKLTGLPVPPTDSIFAVVVEETGLLGAGGLVVLYTILLWRGLTIAIRAPDGLGRLLAAGLSIWLAIEAYINMAVIVGLIPFAGNALPFISAGGSNLIVSLSGIGILQNIARISTQNREEERNIDAVVDLRWRNGRRSVSRSSRPASAP